MLLTKFDHKEETRERKLFDSCFSQNSYNERIPGLISGRFAVRYHFLVMLICELRYFKNLLIEEKTADSLIERLSHVASEMYPAVVATVKQSKGNRDKDLRRVESAYNDVMRGFVYEPILDMKINREAEINIGMDMKVRKMIVSARYLRDAEFEAEDHSFDLVQFAKAVTKLEMLWNDVMEVHEGLLKIDKTLKKFQEKKCKLVKIKAYVTA